MKELLKWLDGKKMNLGLTFAAIAPHAPDDWQPWVYALGILFGGPGSIHKIVKAKKKKVAPSV